MIEIFLQREENFNDKTRGFLIATSYLCATFFIQSLLAIQLAPRNVSSSCFEILFNICGLV